MLLTKSEFIQNIKDLMESVVSIKKIGNVKDTISSLLYNNAVFENNDILCVNDIRNNILGVSIFNWKSEDYLKDLKIEIHKISDNVDGQKEVIYKFSIGFKSCLVKMKSLDMHDQVFCFSKISCKVT